MIQVVTTDKKRVTFCATWATAPGARGCAFHSQGCPEPVIARGQGFVLFHNEDTGSEMYVCRSCALLRLTMVEP